MVALSRKTMVAQLEADMDARFDDLGRAIHEMNDAITRCQWLKERGLTEEAVEVAVIVRERVLEANVMAETWLAAVRRVNGAV